MTDFTTELARLVAQELEVGGQDHDRMASLIERLATALGLVAAITAEGDPAKIDELLMAAEGYAHEEAVSKAEFGRAVAKMRRPRRT